MKKRHSNFGFSSILLTFIMICIATFSALSLLTANSDYRLSRRVAERSEAYYRAQEQAVETLAAIDQALFTAYESCGNAADYYETAVSLISDSTEGVWIESDKRYVFSYAETVADNQQLSVAIELQYPVQSTDPFYRITQWKTIQSDHQQSNFI